MKQTRWICMIGLLIQWLLTGCGETAPIAEVSLVDSLNSRAYTYYYKSLDSVSQAAGKAYKSARYYHTGKAEAANHLGFCAFMRMDFDEASCLFSGVKSLTSNELELLIADIGMMKICQRTARNKAYYDYRNSALRRLRRIKEDITVFADRREKQRLHFAFSEFQLVSATYLYYQQQRPQAQAALDSLSNSYLRQDTAQLIYTYYLRGSAGLCAYDSLSQWTLTRFDYLYRAMQLSRRCDYTYFEANCLQGIAELLIDTDVSVAVSDRRLTYLHDLGYAGATDSLFPYRLANQSLSLFRRYNDLYQIAGTYRTLATWLNRHGRYKNALDTLQKALNCVNHHHRSYYHCRDSAHFLHQYKPGEAACTELEWINSDSIKTVPEWIARIREQLSVAYAGLGMKPASDYNRNCYLDILYNIRQDKELESRYQALEREAMQLNWIIVAVGCGVLFMFVSFWFLNKHWQKRNRKYRESLRSVLELCRHIVSPLPAGTVDVEDIIEVLTLRIQPFFGEMFAVGEVHFCLHGSATVKSQLPFEAKFPLRVSPQSPLIGLLVLGSERRWTKEQMALVRLITPYLVWVIENGQALLLLDDRARQIAKQRHVYEQHIEENKRQNVEKKTCLAIVEGVKPFIDRIVNEVDKLRDKHYALQPLVRAEKYQYIRELADRINEYNDILALWIKMKRGTLSLLVENFALREVFEVVAKGQRTFEAKHQILQVDDSDAVVKADKALTLFMINTLAENARKYTQEGGLIRIYATEFADYVEIAVEDNGRGISAEDVHRILDEKVYDSKRIGLDGNPDSTLMQNKGFGFGLMNCKGIIEQYRKTNALFRVCSFGIESALGKGSRFYFRLPKGVLKTFGWLLLLCMPLLGACHSQEDALSEVSAGDVASAETAFADSLLDEVAYYADRVYEQNVYGAYDEAVCYADSAIALLNAYYVHCTHCAGLMSLRGSGVAVEIAWWKAGFDTDYPVILDLRNEAAVAFLALKQWDAYAFNNEAYTTLYKLVSEDTSLAAFCNQLQHSTSNKIVGVLLCVLVLLCALVGYYIIYIGRRRANSRHLEQVLDINRKAFNAALPCHGEADNCVAVPVRLVEACFAEFKELLSIDCLALAVFDSEEKRLRVVCSPSGVDAKNLEGDMQRCYDVQQPVHSADGWLQCFPLLTEMGETSSCVGVLAWLRSDNPVKENDRLLSELIARYVALIVFGAVVKPAAKNLDIELAEDELRRASFEDNQLHVQNMVLDNCFSTIKHETIYYPNRIKQIVERLATQTSARSDEAEEVEAIYELVSYYRDIYNILSSCASRQLAEVTFRRATVAVADLLKQVVHYYQKASRKCHIVPRLEVEPCSEPLFVSADKIELLFLFSCLIDEALSVEQCGQLLVSACADGNFVRFVFEDRRRTYSREELNRMFYPDLQRLTESGRFNGAAFLVCKQIVRDHDEFAGRRGCRIVAEPGRKGGFQVFFTIPKK